MEDSVTYQAIMPKGKIAALQKALLRVGRKLFGLPPALVESTVNSIKDLQRLETLCDRLLEVKTWEELLAS